MSTCEILFIWSGRLLGVKFNSLSSSELKFGGGCASENCIRYFIQNLIKIWAKDCFILDVSLIHLPWRFVPASYFGPWSRSRSCLRPNKTNSTKWKSNIFQLLCRPLSVFVLLHLFVSPRVVIYSFHCEQGLAVSCLHTWLLVQSTHSPNPT